MIPQPSSSDLNVTILETPSQLMTMVDLSHITQIVLTCHSSLFRSSYLLSYLIVSTSHSIGSLKEEPCLVYFRTSKAWSNLCHKERI